MPASGAEVMRGAGGMLGVPGEVVYTRVYIPGCIPGCTYPGIPGGIPSLAYQEGIPSLAYQGGIP